MFRVLLISLFFSLMGGVFASSSWGSCGDWLQHADNPPASLPTSETASEKSLPPRPCDGPDCGGAPIAPLPATPAPAIERQPIVAACLSDDDRVALLALELATGDFSLHLPDACIEGILRPPRL